MILLFCVFTQVFKKHMSGQRLVYKRSPHLYLYVWELFIGLNSISAHMVFLLWSRMGNKGWKGKDGQILADQISALKCQKPGYFHIFSDVKLGSKLERVQMSINSWMGKNIEVYLYNGILLNNKKNELLIYITIWMHLKVVTPWGRPEKVCTLGLHLYEPIEMHTRGTESWSVGARDQGWEGKKVYKGK